VHGAQPPPCSEIACHLRDVTADPLACAGLLLRPRSRARHSRGACPFRTGLARRRSQRAAFAKASRAPGGNPPDQGARGEAGVRDDPPLLHDGRRGRARGSARDPHLRERPGTSTGSARRPAAVGCSRTRTFLIRSVSRFGAPTICRERCRNFARGARERAELFSSSTEVWWPRQRAARPRACYPRPPLRDRARGRGAERRSVPRGARRPRRHRRGAHRGRGVQESQRPTAHEPDRTGRRHVQS